MSEFANHQQITNLLRIYEFVHLFRIHYSLMRPRRIRLFAHHSLFVDESIPKNAAKINSRHFRREYAAYFAPQNLKTQNASLNYAHNPLSTSHNSQSN